MAGSAPGPPPRRRWKRSKGSGVSSCVYYGDRIGTDLFAEEESRLVALLDAARAETEAAEIEQAVAADVRQRFDQVAAVLADLDVDRTWEAATPAERRVLLEELLESVTVLPDHLDATIAGAPRLNVLLEEVGLKKAPHSQISGVGGGT